MPLDATPKQEKNQSDPGLRLINTGSDGKAEKLTSGNNSVDLQGLEVE